MVLRTSKHLNESRSDLPQLYQKQSFHTRRRGICQVLVHPHHLFKMNILYEKEEKLEIFYIHIHVERTDLQAQQKRKFQCLLHLL